jgi:hypothetical protein
MRRRLADEPRDSHTGQQNASVELADLARGDLHVQEVCS